MPIRFLDEEEVKETKENNSTRVRFLDESPVTEEETPEVTENTEKKPVLQRLLKTGQGALEQAQKGQEITQRELGQFATGEEQEERLTDVPDPKGLLQKSARFAGEYLAPTGATGGLPVVGGAANLTAKLFANRGINPVTKAIAKGAKVSHGFVGEVLSSVPREFFESAIGKEVAGNSIFKGSKKSFEDLGKKAQKAMNFVVNLSGEAVGAEKAALRGKKVSLPVQKYIDSIDDKIAEITIDELSELDEKDFKTLGGIKDLLIKEGTKRTSKEGVEEIFVDAAKLNIIKKKMQKLTKFGIETVEKASSEGQGILKNVSGQIGEDLGLAIPELGAANAKFSKASNIKKALQTTLKDKSVERNVRNLTTKDEFTKDLLRQVDEIVPDDLKFYEDIQDTIVRESFDKIFPGRGGGSGGAEGFASILRIGSLGATQPLALPLLSPKIQQFGVQGVGLGAKGGRAIGRGLSKLPAGVKGKAALKARELIRQREDN